MPPFDKKLNIQLSKSISYFENFSMGSIFVGPPPAEARGSKATKMQKAMLRKLRAACFKTAGFFSAVFSLPPDLRQKEPPVRQKSHAKTILKNKSPWNYR